MGDLDLRRGFVSIIELPTKDASWSAKGWECESLQHQVIGSLWFDGIQTSWSRIYIGANKKIVILDWCPCKISAKTFPRSIWVQKTLKFIFLSTLDHVLFSEYYSEGRILVLLKGFKSEWFILGGDLAVAICYMIPWQWAELVDLIILTMKDSVAV